MIVTRRLRHVGQRFTSQRRALVDVLTAAPSPLTLPQLLERSTGLAQSSAYRNLAVLERAGVAHRIVTTGDHACWELAEDLTLEEGGYRNPPCPYIPSPTRVGRTRRPRKIVYQFGRCTRLAR